MELVVIFGPPAVGKMTVGRALARLTGYRLLLNAHISEFMLEIFGLRDHSRLHHEFTLQIFEEAARERIDLVSTTAIPFENPLAVERLRARHAAAESAGARVSYAELGAPFTIRLERNRHEDRRREKPRQANVLTDDRFRSLETSTWNTASVFPLAARHARFDTSAAAPELVAREIAAAFQLPPAMGTDLEP